jgi:hypothetical protein
MSNPSYTPPQGGQPRPSYQIQTQLLLQIGQTAELFRTPEGDLYAEYETNGHWQIAPLLQRESGFRRWLAYQYYQQTGKPPNRNALGEVMELLRAIAANSTVRSVFTRVGFDNNAIYLDLANDRREVVEITAMGWRIIGRSPVAFRSARGMLSLPTPDRNGDITLLRQFINIATDKDWKLLVGFLLGTLMPHGPYPHLALYGEHGSAKSMATRLLRALVDPNVGMARGLPKDLRDLAIAAKNSWVLAFDNVSHLPASLSDAFCRLSTGAASSDRALYTDDEEFLFSAKRPVIFNAIGEVATRGDLIDRLIVVNLKQPQAYSSEQELWQGFEQARPAILGGLLNVISRALRDFATTPGDPKIRLTDFARWVEAAAPALGWQPGVFTQEMHAMRAEAIDIEIEASPFAVALLDISLKPSFLPWQDSPTKLYEQLTARLTGARLPDGWPGNARAMSIELKRLTPALRTKGLVVRIGKWNGARQIRIDRSGP